MNRMGSWGVFAAALLLTGCEFSPGQNQLNYSPAENHLTGNQTPSSSTSTPTPTPAQSAAPTSTPVPTPSVAMTGNVTLIPQGLSTFQGLASNNVLSVYVVGSTIYAGTDHGLSITANGGSTWTTKTTAQGLGSNIIASLYVSGSTVYALTTGGLSISTNGGSSFTNNSSVSGTSMTVSGSNVYVQGSVYFQVSHDGGNTFTQINSPEMGSSGTGQVAISGSTVYVASIYGLFISTNGGNTFARSTLPSGSWATGVAVNGSNVYVAVASTGIMISTNSGASFTAGATYTNMTGQLAVSGSTLAMGTVAALLVSTDGGSTVTYANAPNPYTLNGVFMSGSTLYGAAEDGGVMVATNSGQSVSMLTSTNPLCATTALAGAGSTLYLGGTCGIQSTSNGGSTFTTNSGVLDVNQLAVSGSSIYAATLNGLGISTNGGSTFSMKTTAQGLGSNNAQSVFVNGSDVYVGSFVGSRTGTGYVAPTTPEGILSVSTDGGNTFTSQSSQNLGAEISNIFATGSDIFGAAMLTGSSLNLQTGTTTQPTYGLIRSSNGGTSFTSQTWPGVTVYGVSGSGNTILMSTSAGLYISADGGNTFALRTVSQGLASNIVNNAYVVGGDIYAGTGAGLSVSTDGGNTFGTVRLNGVGSVTVSINDFYVSGTTFYALTNLGLLIGQL